MTPNAETTRGIEYLQQIFESGKILRVAEPRVLTEFGESYYFNLKGYGKEWDFAVSRDQLSDLPAMRKYQQSAKALAKSLEQRFRNLSPHIFLTESGKAITVAADWPLRSLHPRAATCVKVSVTLTQGKGFAHCYVVITHSQSTFELKEDPFQLQEALVNSLRTGIDLGEIKFYPSEIEHPIEMQPVSLRLGSRTPPAGDISEFLKRKVELLGFRLGDKGTSVWIADPWDADYLGVTTSDLRQEADILEAEQFITLDEAREFAKIDRSLLIELKSRRQASAPSHRAPRTTDAEFDVFLSHASEDKEFVRKLASALKERGISYWLDEIQIQLGDSLRGVIDKGLASSRFGVVVLSKHFFAKRWPQMELDGLLAKEIDCKVILPIWHEITESEVRMYSPTLAGRYAAIASDGPDAVADKIVNAIRVV